MIPINETYALNKESKFDSDLGWKKITVHNLYPTRITPYRKNHLDMGWRIKNLFFPSNGWKNEPFKKRLELLKHGHILPGGKVYHIDYEATATCDGEFQTRIGWGTLEEEIIYGIYNHKKG